MSTSACVRWAGTWWLLSRQLVAYYFSVPEGQVLKSCDGVVKSERFRVLFVFLTRWGDGCVEDTRLAVINVQTAAATETRVRMIRPLLLCLALATDS